VTAT